MHGKLRDKLTSLDIIYEDKVKLVNAGKSDYYIDIKKAYGYVLKDICEEVHEKMDKETTCVAGSGHGGIPLAAGISASYGLRLCLVRERQKDHGLTKIIDGYIPGKEDKVAIVDDVLTTGGSLIKVIETITPTQAEIIGCYVVVKRGECSLPVPLRYLFEYEKKKVGLK